ATLPYRIRRVTNDDPDIGLALAYRALVVLREHRLIKRAPALGHLEGVGEHDTGKRFVVATGQLVVSLLDIDRRDVVGERDDLVAVEFVAVLTGQVLRLDQTAL